MSRTRMDSTLRSIWSQSNRARGLKLHYLGLCGRRHTHAYTYIYTHIYTNTYTRLRVITHTRIRIYFIFVHCEARDSLMRTAVDRRQTIDLLRVVSRFVSANSAELIALFCRPGHCEMYAHDAAVARNRNFAIELADALRLTIALAPKPTMIPRAEQCIR